MSNIPTVSVDEVAQDNMGIMIAMHAVLSSLGNTVLAFFLAIVPERGADLWLRFKEFQRQPGNEATGFEDFVRTTIQANITKLFYPQDCTLDEMTRGFLASEVQTAVRGIASTNEQMLGIFFGAGPVYEAAKRVSCQGCPMTKCHHQLRMRH